VWITIGSNVLIGVVAVGVIWLRWSKDRAADRKMAQKRLEEGIGRSKPLSTVQKVLLAIAGIAFLAIDWTVRYR
jgi:hypothetical protein